MSPSLEELEQLGREPVTDRIAASATQEALGGALANAGRLEEAARAYTRAIELNPDAVGAIHHLAGLYGAGLGRYDAALPLWVRLIRRAPEDPNALQYYVGLGVACLDGATLDDALRRAEEALAPLSQPVRILEGIAAGLFRTGRHDDARRCGEMLLARCPTSIVGLTVRPEIETEATHDLEAAGRYWRLALQVAPMDLTMNVRYVLHLTRIGRLAEARDHLLKLIRHPAFGQLPGPYGKPMWDGTPPQGRTMLLTAEHSGFGDFIQFARLPAYLARLGATVILQVRRPVQRLLLTAAGIDTLVDAADPPPPFDVSTPQALSWLLVPEALDDLGACVPYLHPPRSLVDAWAARIPQTGRLRVGLVWHGSTGKFNNPHVNRNVPFDQVRRILEVPDVDFYSLQVGARARDPEQAGADLPPLPIERDFMETAAAAANLDLIVTVDTAVAHLAGALGRPTFTMLPFTAAWRWMPEGEDSAWYPTMRLFRASSPGDWTPVIARVRGAIADTAQTRRELFASAGPHVG